MNYLFYLSNMINSFLRNSMTLVRNLSLYCSWILMFISIVPTPKEFKKT